MILRTRITALAREEQRLRYEIRNRERRIQVLEVALRRAQAGELADIEKRRRELESEVSAEREAIRWLPTMKATAWQYSNGQLSSSGWPARPARCRAASARTGNR